MCGTAEGSFALGMIVGFLLYFTSTAGAGQPQKQRLPLGIPGAKGCLEKMNASSLQT